MGRSAIMLMLIAALSSAQERPIPPERRDLAPVHDSTAVALPTIDLPEFVITGRSSIELPRVEKRLENGEPTGNVVIAAAPAVRDRTSGPAPGANRDGRPPEASGPGFQGLLRAGLGSYQMPLLNVSVRTALDVLTVSARGHYRRSSGFAPETDWSEGGGGTALALPLNLASAGVQSASLSGDLGYESRSYHWYGTARPSDRRMVSIMDGGLAARGSLGGWTGGLSLRFGSTTLDDTTSSLTEAITRLRADGGGSVEGVPIFASLSVLSSSRSLSTTGPAGLTTFEVESRWQPVASVWVAGGLGAAYLQGDGGQKRGFVWPTVRIQFAIDERHRLSGAFEPRADGITMMSSQSRHRFLDAGSPLRQTSWTNAGRFGLESEWSSDLRTRVEIEAGTARDLAMIADTSGRGVARWHYGDASFAALRADCIAKMRRNDYFSATIIVRSSRNAVSGFAVPYWPGFEASASYTAVVLPAFSVRGAVQIVGAREVEWTGASQSLPGHAIVDLSGTYLILPSLSVWMEATNVTNTVYQYWKGIQEPPFRLSAGISLAW